MIVEEVFCNGEGMWEVLVDGIVQSLGDIVKHSRWPSRQPCANDLQELPAARDVVVDPADVGGGIDTDAVHAKIAEQGQLNAAAQQLRALQAGMARARPCIVPQHLPRHQ